MRGLLIEAERKACTGSEEHQCNCNISEQLKLLLDLQLRPDGHTNFVLQSHKSTNPMLWALQGHRKHRNHLKFVIGSDWVTPGAGVQNRGEIWPKVRNVATSTTSAREKTRMRYVCVLALCAGMYGCGQEAAKPHAAPPVAAASPAAPPAPSPTTYLDSKAVAKCAANTNAVSRLACFDEFAKVNGLAQSTTQTTSTGSGKWITKTDSDPLTDKAVHVAMLESDDGRGIYGQKVALVVRCKDRRTEVYVNWNSYLGSDGIMVTSRVDKEPAAKTYWQLSTDSKASFMPQSVPVLKKFIGGSSYVASLTPYNESPITAVFDIAGADVALKDIRSGCNW